MKILQHKTTAVKTATVCHSFISGALEVRNK